MKVRAILGETCRYHVQSSSNPNRLHLVDLLEHECSCTDWTCRQRGYRERTGQRYHCRHIRAAREEFLNDILERLKEDQLAR